MTTVYALLLLGLLGVVLYATWRPSSKSRMRQLQKARMKTNPAGVQATTRTDLTPLDYPVTDVAMDTWAAARTKRNAQAQS